MVPVDVESEPDEVRQVCDYIRIAAMINCKVRDSDDNLFMAGKCISADSGAIASARVIGCCLATGEAAARLAAKRISTGWNTESAQK